MSLVTEVQVVDYKDLMVDVDYTDHNDGVEHVKVVVGRHYHTDRNLHINHHDFTHSNSSEQVVESCYYSCDFTQLRADVLVYHLDYLKNLYVQLFFHYFQLVSQLLFQYTYFTISVSHKNSLALVKLQDSRQNDFALFGLVNLLNVFEDAPTHHFLFPRF